MRRAILVLIYLLLLSSGCMGSEEAKEIDLSDRVEVGIPAEDESLKIGVAAIVSPQETFVYYREFFDYISQRIDKPVKLVQRKTYLDMTELIKKGYVDAAFVCSGVYVKGRDQYRMELLVAPVVNGETVYYSYTIVPKDSNVTSFGQLDEQVLLKSDKKKRCGAAV